MTKQEAQDAGLTNVGNVAESYPMNSRRPQAERIPRCTCERGALPKSHDDDCEFWAAWGKSRYHANARARNARARNVELIIAAEKAHEAEREIIAAARARQSKLLKAIKGYELDNDRIYRELED